MIYQAGASPRGVRFAAENAEAIFIAGPSKRILAQTVSRVRDALEAARAKREEYLSSASIEGGLMFMSGWMESTDTAVAYDPVAGQGAQSGLIQAQRLVAAAAVHDGPFDEQWITDQYAAFLAARSDAAAKVTRLFLSDPNSATSAASSSPPPPLTRRSPRPWSACRTVHSRSCPSTPPPPPTSPR